MPLLLVRNDITKMQVDAIVNPASPSLRGGGGVDGALHKAAGPRLLEECMALGGCETGQAKLTGAYELPCRYVIHTVGPRWRGGFFGEGRLLASCYRSALALAREKACESIAFPLISTGAYGYPKDKALKVALDTVGEFLLENDMTVYLVMFGGESVALSRRLFPHLQEYIDDHYVQEHEFPRSQRMRDHSAPAAFEALPGRAKSALRPADCLRAAPAAKPRFSLEELVNELDESFQQMLFRKIDERGMTDAQCYKKANIDRKLFSKIRKDVFYKPSKATAVAFAVALELDMRETAELLKKAGFALSGSSKFDVIVQYFIERGNYNIFEINEALFYYDQSLLGT